MPIINRVKWGGSPDILAWKYHFANKEELSTWTQLIVNETQDAYLVNGGVYEGPFKAGRHTLSTDNLPVLRDLLGIPFGGKSPFSAEVWFVNKIKNPYMKWGTFDPIYVSDPIYNILIPIRSFGQYGIRVIDSKKFLLNLVGTQEIFTFDMLNKYFISKILSAYTEIFLNFTRVSGETVFNILSKINKISDDVRLKLQYSFNEYGLELINFDIQSINIPEDNPEVQFLKKTLAEKTSMGLIGYDYQQKRTLDVMETAAGNAGGSNDIIGAGMGLSIGASFLPLLQEGLNGGVKKQEQTPKSTDDKISRLEHKMKLLRELGTLRKENIVSQDEFEQEKKNIIESFNG